MAGTPTERGGLHVCRRCPAATPTPAALIAEKRKVMVDRANIWIPTVLLVLAACGDDDNGNEDSLLTGFSGLVIVAVVIWLIVRAKRRRT